MALKQNKLIVNLQDLLHYASMEILWSKEYWIRSHQLGKTEYSEQDINEAFNKWNWATHDLEKAIEKYNKQLDKEKKEKDKLFLFEPEYKSKTIDEIMKEDKEFTRLEHENSYGVKTTIFLNTEDPDVDECVNAFYTLMISATYQECTILKAMKQFAEDKLAVLEKQNED